MAKTKQQKSGENLAETLSIGNFTGSNDIVITPNDKIKSGSGSATINMYFDSSDNSIIISSNLDDASDTYISLEDLRCFIKGNRSTLDMLRDKISLLYGDSGTSNNAFMALGFQQLQILSLSSFLPSTYNNSSLFIFSTAGAGLDISLRVATSTCVAINSGITGELTIIKPAVSRSVAIGGRGLNLKTSETAYCNQISFQESGNLFDTLIIPPTATADRAQTLQDKSGTIALLDDTNFLGSTTTPATIAVDTNDYAPTGLINKAWLRLSSSSNIELTGLSSTGFVDRNIVVLTNVGGLNIKLKKNNLGSIAANRFLIKSDITLEKDGESVQLVYDAASLGWRAIGTFI